jgi:hypothetical protein
MVVLRYITDEQKLGHLYGNLREIEKRLLRTAVANGVDVKSLSRETLTQYASFDQSNDYSVPDLAGAAAVYLRIRRDIDAINAEHWESINWTIEKEDQIQAATQGLSQIEQRLITAAAARGIGLVELEGLDGYEGEEWDELKDLARKLATGTDYVETLEQSVEGV